MSGFVHLHTHTQYSLLDGQASVKKLVDKAIKDGMPGIAITDHGNMFAIKEFMNYVGKTNKGLKGEGKEPFKPIIGCEVYVARRGDLNLKTEKADRVVTTLSYWPRISRDIKICSKLYRRRGPTVSTTVLVPTAKSSRSITRG